MSNSYFKCGAIYILLASGYGQTCILTSLRPPRSDIPVASSSFQYSWPIAHMVNAYCKPINNFHKTFSIWRSWELSVLEKNYPIIFLGNSPFPRTWNFSLIKYFPSCFDLILFWMVLLSPAISFTSMARGILMIHRVKPRKLELYWARHISLRLCYLKWRSYSFQLN